MESVPEFLKYITVTALGTAFGIFYWMALENVRARRFSVIHVFLLSLALSPVGAWAVTTLFRAAEGHSKTRIS